MENRYFLVLGALALACHPKTKPVAEDAGPAPTVAAPANVADAAPPPAPDEPLTWGTRPSEKGPFFPVVDGICGGSIAALEGKTIFAGDSGFARFEDEGLVPDPSYEKAAEKSKREAWGSTQFTQVSGTWPRLVLFSEDRGGGRMRSYESIWVHEDAGWSYFGSSDEKDQPSYTSPLEFQDWLVTWRRAIDPKAEAEVPSGTALMQAWPMKKDAPPIPGLAALARRKFTVSNLAVAGHSLYAFGYDEGKGFDSTPVVRVLKDGKVTEGSNPARFQALVGTKDDSLFVLGNDGVIRRHDGAKATALPFKTKGGASIVGAGIAPNGEVWALTSKSEVLVLRDGTVSATPLPAPAVKWPVSNGQHGPENNLLAGVEYDDPYAIGETGSLYHLERGEWHEVTLPDPPFASTGKYHARRVVIPAKGDVYVVTSYYEKGIGWKTPEMYRGVLRNRRPRETLRCNEAGSRMRLDIQPIGHGFSSAPPVANETCTTPLVILMRMGTKEQPSFLYDKGFPALRAAIKETPGLGATAEILELPWTGVQVVAMKAPDMATAKTLAENAAKRVKN